MSLQQLIRIVVVACVLAPNTYAWADAAPRYRRVAWSDWNADPVMITAFATVAWLYARGLLRLWEKVGVGRIVAPWQAFAAGAGLLALGVALLSPLDPLSDQLGLAHMIQHMLISTIAAPLIVLGTPFVVVLWGMHDANRRHWRHALNWAKLWRPLRQAVRQPLFVAAIYFAVLWGWHYPTLYEWALYNPYVHDVQHFTFFATAILFWRLLIAPRSRFRLPAGLAILLLFGATMQATMLGVFMTLAPTPWYPSYYGTTELWGLTALEDQQVAGLIMWMPACAAYLAAALVLFSVVTQAKPRVVRQSARKLGPIATRRSLDSRFID